jgi:hypothetical protein
MSGKDFQGSLSEGSEKVAKETWQVNPVRNSSGALFLTGQKVSGDK